MLCSRFDESRASQFNLITGQFWKPVLYRATQQHSRFAETLTSLTKSSSLSSKWCFCVYKRQMHSRYLTFLRIRWKLERTFTFKSNQIILETSFAATSKCKYPNVQQNPSFPVASAQLLIGVAWRRLHLWHSPPVNVRHDHSWNKLISAYWGASNEVNRQDCTG